MDELWRAKERSCDRGSASIKAQVLRLLTSRDKVVAVCSGYPSGALSYVGETPSDVNTLKVTADGSYQANGDLDAESVGQMLIAGNVKSSAGYAAIECITGTIETRKGSFTLLHKGLMTKGTQVLSIEVVPDSGTGHLLGLTGSMTLQGTTDGGHTYTFEYSLPPTARTEVPAVPASRHAT